MNLISIILNFSYRFHRVEFSCLLILFFIFSIEGTTAQRTAGLISHAAGSDDEGYILFAPYDYNKIYLIDKCGKLVHSWTSIYSSIRTPYILPDGKLLVTGQWAQCSSCQGGVIGELDWEGKIAWSKVIADSVYCQHHDVIPLPNGNILAIVSEAKTREEAIAAGRNPSLFNKKLLNEKVIEIRPLGVDSAEIIWEWSIWDHLVQDFDREKSNYGNIAGHPELVNLNYSIHSASPDWIHLNSLDYNPDLDQVLLSSPFFNEIWIIDHSTTKNESSGHRGGKSGKGGDLLFRWGNPATFNSGRISDQKLFGVHNPHWIEKPLQYGGNIIFFNNGMERPGRTKYSTIEIISTPPCKDGNYGPSYRDFQNNSIRIYGDSLNPGFYSQKFSGVQILQSKNFLICSGAKGKLFEIDSLKNIVWEYICPVNSKGPVQQGVTSDFSGIFRCNFYDKDYKGFLGIKLIPGQPIEIDTINYDCNLSHGNNQTYYSSSTLNNTNMVNKTTVNELDLKRYLGTWYEIARFQHSFEKDLVRVTADYILRKDGKIGVLNQGYKNSLNGRLKKAAGKAKATDIPGKFKVSFFLFFYADYLVLELDHENYQWALVGSSSSNYLWILSRTPDISSELYASIVEKAKKRGYDVSKLFRVPQPDKYHK